MPEIQDSLRCPGMRDLAGADMERMRAVEQAFAAACRAWSFHEIRTPLIEYLHLYTMSGALSPQLLGRVYSFLDWDGWSGERVVLRPDSTVAVARLYGERFAPDGARLFYTQSVLRFAPAGEEREAWQAGAEIIGEPPGAADIELVLLSLEVFERLQLPRPQVVISHPGIVRALLGATGGSGADQQAAYDRILDGESDALAKLAESLPSNLRPAVDLIFGVEGSSESYLSNVEAALASHISKIDQPLAELRTAVAMLSKLVIPYTISNALVRDFEYYTGTVFHLRHEGQLLGGGGRYDQLVQLVSGRAAPACGFALDTEAIAAMVELEFSQQHTVTVLSSGEATLGGALKLVRALHARGISAVLNPSSANGVSVRAGAEDYTLDGHERRLSLAEVLTRLETELAPP